MKATEISTEHPEFDSYFQMHLKKLTISICQHTKMATEVRPIMDKQQLQIN
jgi:hypothetical protein